MAEPVRQLSEGDQPNKPPQLGKLQGGGETSPPRSGHLGMVPDEEESNKQLPEEDKAVTKPQLSALEGGGETSPPKSGHLEDASNKSGGLYRAGGSEGLSTKGLLGAETDTGGMTNTSGRGKKLVGFAKRHKKAMLGGTGSVIGVAMLVVSLIGGIVGYQLVSMEKVLIRYEAKIEQRFEKKADQQIAKQISCRLVKTGCSGDNDPEDNGETAAEEAASGAEGDLAENEAKVNFADPAVEAELAGEGIKVKVNNGTVDGFTDDAGNDITSEIGSNDQEFDKFDSALPEWQAAQVTTVDPIAVDHSGVVLDPIPEGTTEDEVDKTVTEDIVDGENGSTIGQASAEDQESSDTNPKDQTAADNPTKAADITGTTGNALSATEQAIADGETEPKALAAGEAAFNPGDPLLLSTVASDVCSVKKTADQASKARVPKITALLVRHAGLVLSAADELKSGKLTGGVVNKLMGIFNGDPTQPKTDSDGEPDEAAMSYDQSAAWQRDTGGSINTDPKSSSYTPDIESSALPTANSGTKVVASVDSVVSDIPGGNFICVAQNSIFGGIINGFAGVAQFIGDDASFGLLQIGITGAGLAVQETLQKVVIPAILKYFTPVGIDGAEDSAQWFNNADAGTNLLFNDYSRAIGGEPLTNSQSETLADKATVEQNQQYASLPWAERVLSTSNPNSLVSHVALSIPTNLSGLFIDFSNLFSGIPKYLGDGFSTILSPFHTFAQTNPPAPGEAYGITQYGFTDSDVTKYDPIQNEQYLYTPVTYNGKTAKRIDMLGDPNNYQQNMVDTSTTDLLHCFIDGYDSSTSDAGDGSADWSTGNNDPICGSEGSYDYANDTPQAADPTNPNNTNDTVITDTNIAVVYCDYLAPGDSGCQTSSALLNQLHDDIGHFRQYILDSHVVNDYVSLTSGQ